jgi:GMP synthase (glutamine-hydrolysing)
MIGIIPPMFGDGCPRVANVKPFLLLAIRAEAIAADEEYAAMLRCTGLNERQLRRARLEQAPLDPVDLDHWSGIILGGGPFQASDPESTKSALQRRIEADLAALLDQVVQHDFPFLGACYGIGTLGQHQGAVVDRAFGEPIGGIFIDLTPEGWQDPLLKVAGSPFGAYVGHKEAIRTLPPHAVSLASSRSTPRSSIRSWTLPGWPLASRSTDMPAISRPSRLMPCWPPRERAGSPRPRICSDDSSSSSRGTERSRARQAALKAGAALSRRPCRTTGLKP